MFDCINPKMTALYRLKTGYIDDRRFLDLKSAHQVYIFKICYYLNDHKICIDLWICYEENYKELLDLDLRKPLTLTSTKIKLINTTFICITCAHLFMVVKN